MVEGEDTGWLVDGSREEGTTSSGRDPWELWDQQWDRRVRARPSLFLQVGVVWVQPVGNKEARDFLWHCAYKCREHVDLVVEYDIRVSQVMLSKFCCHSSVSKESLSQSIHIGESPSGPQKEQTLRNSVSNGSSEVGTMDILTRCVPPVDRDREPGPWWGFWTFFFF